MAFEIGAEPYVPNIVSITELDDDPILSLQRLQRFLSEEFTRIATAMEFVPVQASYGAVLVSPGPAPDQPLDKGVETPLEGFNDFSPAVPNRVITVTTGGPDSLQVEESGVFLIQTQITASIDSGTSYTVTLAINGVLTDIFGQVDASNQTSIVTISFHGLSALRPGDILTLVAVATAAPAGPFTFIMLSATFSTVRVSELHKGD